MKTTHSANKVTVLTHCFALTTSKCGKWTGEGRACIPLGLIKTWDDLIKWTKYIWKVDFLLTDNCLTDAFREMELNNG